MTVYLDTETTGLNAGYDELLEIAIVDSLGVPLLNTLLKPLVFTEWQEAQNIHGITPMMVANAPTFSDIFSKIEAVVKDQDVVIYNADFDTAFLGSLLASAKSVKCCMLAWAKHVGEWSEYHGNYRWHKLVDAAETVYFKWTGEAHRALPDALACRAVWLYLTDTHERQRVDSITREKEIEREANFALADIAFKQKLAFDRRSKFMTKFIEHWFLGRYGIKKHWANDYGYRHELREHELVMVFFGKSLKMLKLEEQFDTIYTEKKAIPNNLKPASFFSSEKWFQNELIPSAAYVGKKCGWKLYNISENERIRDLYPLRCAVPTLAQDEALLNRTQLKKQGYSDQEIIKLTPIVERQNYFNLKWYYLYQVPKAL